MLIRSASNGFDHPHASEITPQATYLNRRAILQRLAAGAAGAAGASGVAWASRSALAQAARPGKLAPLAGVASSVAGAVTMEKPTDYQDVTSYNNFTEFGFNKSDASRHAHAMRTQPWSIEVEGLVAKPGRFALEDLLKLAPMEQRTYRLRCVEGWSMVIPWLGYSVSHLLKRAEPLGSARFVEFVTLADANAMPGLRSRVLEWPYTEALRLDEAMHPLALLAFGLYGEVLPNQNGAPVRLVVPWKYGFKSSKSIVKLRVVERAPRTTWNVAAPEEYGFFANVNPEVEHPRWSQATERRIGEDGLFSRKRKTLPFNGYEAQVGQLYAGMDLRKFY